MAQGTVIDYALTLNRVPMSWRTVIERWKPDAGFTDAQHQGPYRAWWHEHDFVARGDRTVMRDRVYYAPPLGPSAVSPTPCSCVAPWRASSASAITPSPCASGAATTSALRHALRGDQAVGEGRQSPMLATG